TIHVVGSPAIDGIGDIAPMSDAESRALGNPRGVLLLHPSGLADERERAIARETASSLGGVLGSRVLWLAPNLDPGRGVLIEEVRAIAEDRGWTQLDHLPRAVFVSLLKRLSCSQQGTRGVLIGNSSAGLIEAAALGVPTINVGPRQNGRERAGNIADVPEHKLSTLTGTLRASLDPHHGDASWSHPYGDGHSGEKIAAILAEPSPGVDNLVRKRCTY
ncbi:MAG: UDP-N-acetylglucosamine 2-epimerase, partial [Pyrinomonadaceae bacterium]|nr:UDP-N-acetylglucosamine 2-epimerase [Phycisphaerales bacterium]